MAVAALLLVATAGSSPALARQPTFRFNIGAKPLGPALVELALTARVSISLQNLAVCAARGRPLIGVFTVQEGLSHLLAGTGCRARRLDDLAFELAPVREVERRNSIPEAHFRGQDPLSAAVSQLVVVATRRPTPVDGLAYAVSAMDRESLTALGVLDLSDLALATPAMTLTNLGMGRDKILLRGLSDGPLTGQTQAMVGLYLDDTRLTYNAPDPDLKLVDVASVEVLRGPQGALYGAGSLGGVVHIVSMQPDPARLAAWASASLGATQGGAGSRDLEAGLNLPLAHGGAAARIVFYREIQGGYVDDVMIGIKNANKVVRSGDRINLRWDVSPRWSLSAGMVQQAINAADTQYSTAGLSPYTRATLVREPHDNDFSESHLAVHGDLDWARAKGSVALIDHSLKSRFDASAASPITVPSSPDAYDEADSTRALVSEATLAAPSDAKVQWLAGGFYAHTRQTTNSALTAFGSSPILALEELRRDSLDEVALYGQVATPLTSSLSLTLGGRLFASHEKVTSLIRAPPIAAGAPFSGSIGEPGFAPQFVVSYARAPSLLVYAQAGEGYRSEGVNTTGLPSQAFSGPRGPEPFRYYQGDELWNLETGAKLSLFANSLKLRMAAFEAFWKNIQSSQLLPSGLPFTANLGDGRNTGAEIEAAYRLGELELQGHVLVNGPELDHANPAFSARADVALSAVPNLAAGASARYRWVLPQGRMLELNGRWAYVGTSQLMLNATTIRQMGDYATGRLSASVISAHYRWTVSLDNPANVQANTFAFGNPFSLRSSQQITPLRPRTVSVTLSASY